MFGELQFFKKEALVDGLIKLLFSWEYVLTSVTNE